MYTIYHDSSHFDELAVELLLIIFCGFEGSRKTCIADAERLGKASARGGKFEAFEIARAQVDDGRENTPVFNAEIVA